ncbi:hypothetical protein P12x_000854 [Tundrisphaera lichenicola]|uniref:hypothetical protein n=1 Tax=Tundrisphaera lichenicola TaxID=2029860 RepID=UPI003EBCEE7A
MADRKSLVSTLWLSSSLVLLASVLFAPIPTSGVVTHSSRPESHLLHLAQTLAPGQPATCLRAAMVSVSIFQITDLLSENEEQDRIDAPDEPRVSFLIPYSFRKNLDRQLIAPLSITSLYPLRC